MPVRSRPARVAALVAALVVLAGCRLDLVAGLEVARDGSGRAGLTVTVDRALLAELDALAVDPTADLEAAVAAQDPADGWTVERTSDGDGGLVVAVSRPAATPAALTGVLRDLSAGLSDADPALEVDLDLDVAADGAAEVAGTAAFRAPAGPGVLGDPTAVDAEELAALTAEAVTAEVAVTLPGAPTDHDADAVDGRRLTWTLAVGEERRVTASAAAPTSPPTETIVAIAAGTLVALSLLAAVVVVWRRRRSRADR